MSFLNRFRTAVALLFLWSPAYAERPNLVFRLGLDALTTQQSAIDGLSGMSLFVVSKRGYYFGESIYSAAIGAGGGFFVGGVELGKTTQLGERFFVDASLFIGGGGGATAGPDTLNGNATDNTLDGLGGNDILSGLGGNDTLIGSGGNDTLIGGSGRDTLIGGTYTNNTAASAGADIFKFTVQSDSPYVSDTNNWDIIKGFDADDRIDVSELVTIGIADDIFDKGDSLSPTPGSGTNFFDFGGLGPAMVAVGSTGNTGLLYVDVNGDGNLSGADLAVLFAGATNADLIDAATGFVA